MSRISIGSYWMLLPILFLSLLQEAFLPINFVLLFFIVWASVSFQLADFIEKASQKIFLTAFLTGLIQDLAGDGRLGFLSLIYLLVGGFLVVYSRRFDSTRPWFLAGFIFIANLVISFLGGRPDLSGSFILAIIALMTGGFLSFFSGGGRIIKLKI